MKKFLLLCFVSGIIQALSSPSDNDSHEGGGFGYDENDPLGPIHWPEKYKACAGKYQSPIDIEESLVTRVSLPPLRFTGFNISSSYSKITNNGHTVMVELNDNTVLMSGGPLSAPLYKMAQFHFHWGMNDSSGSEDLVNNHSYPMELHVVFYQNDYNNTVLAQQYMDGLAVLAFFFEVSEKDNPAYASIVHSLSNIENPKTSVHLNDSLKLIDLLPTNFDNYFTYMGSLTTPPCSEGVRWIDFKHPIRLSHEQKFRTIHSTKGNLTHNARPIQPLSNRPVWYNSGSPTNLALDSEPKMSNSIKNQIQSILFLSCIVPMLYF